MSFKTSCPSCGQNYAAENEHWGMKMECTNCAASFVVRKPLPPPIINRVKKDPPKYALDAIEARRIVEEKENLSRDREQQKEDQIDKLIQGLCDDVRADYSSNALNDFTIALQEFEAVFKKLDKITDVVDDRNKIGRRPVPIVNGYKDLLLAWDGFCANKLNPPINSFYTSDLLDLIVELNGKIITSFSKMSFAFNALAKPTQNKIEHAYSATLDLVNENVELLHVAISTSEQDVMVWGAQISKLKDIQSTLNDSKEIDFMEQSLLRSWSEVLVLRASVYRAKTKMVSYLGLLKKTLK